MTSPTPPPAQPPAQPPKRPVGLSSIEQAKKDRGRGKWTRATPKLYGYIALAVIASLVFYRVFSGRELAERKSKLLGKQRAVASELGPKWNPLRDQIEKTTLGAAAAFGGDSVDPAFAKVDFLNDPGIYLRMRVADAKDSESLRKAARESMKDGFVACLAMKARSAAFARPAATADGGAPPATTPAASAPGAAADAALAASFPDQPWNLRQAYASTRILSEPWLKEVDEADEDLRLRVFEQQLEGAMKKEIPLAVDMVTRAKYFLLVLDEDVPEARALADGGAVTEEELQLVAHPSRVVVVNLKSGREVARLRKTGAASFIPAGERPVSDPEVKAAMQRQVNNCALAQEVVAAGSKR